MASVAAVWAKVLDRWPAFALTLGLIISLMWLALLIESVVHLFHFLWLRS
jgi:hypothetical protein